MRRFIVPGVLLVLATAACTQDAATDEQPETPTTVSAAPTTTTTAAKTTTTTMAAATTAVATTTTVPYVWPWANEAHAYAYQSVGYSCGPDPTTGCEGDADMTLDEIWLHKETDSTTADCLDLRMKAHPNNVLHKSGYSGLADDEEELAGTGWGVRLVQLDASPAGFDIGGEAWLELTVSSASAGDFAARPTTSPDRTKEDMTKFLEPTGTDPISITAPPEATNVVEELVLINTTDDMMQWIIALTDDQVYHHLASYGWGYSRTALTIKINEGETN